MYKNILLAVDLQDSKSWQKSKSDTVALAREFDAILHVITVVPTYHMSIVGSYFPRGYEQNLLETTRVKLHEFVQEHVGEDMRVQHIVGHGNVYEEILRVGADVGADLIILGASRPLAGNYLPGPNAERVTTHAHCSVLVVRGD